MRAATSFYSTVDRETVYETASASEHHDCHGLVEDFVGRHGLETRKFLEVGSGTGVFQDVVKDYTGVDVSEGLRRHYHKPFVVVASALLPFPDRTFDAVIACRVHEHIPDIETALSEIERILKPGGVCMLAPAWHTRPWFAEGLAVRPWRDLTLRQRAVKATIPLRDCRLVRWPTVLLRRCLHLIPFLAAPRVPRPLRYRRLTANYEKYWQSDSDACNSLDPFDLCCWFVRRDFTCLTCASTASMLLCRAIALEFRKNAFPSRGSAR